MTEFEQIMADALKNAGGQIDVATDFVTRNMPDLVQQAMWWYGLTSFFLMSLGFLGWFKCYFYFKENLSKEDWLDNNPPPVIIFYTIWLCASLVLIIGGYAWIKILIAPKLWLIEFAASLVK